MTGEKESLPLKSQWTLPKGYKIPLSSMVSEIGSMGIHPAAKTLAIQHCKWDFNKSEEFRKYSMDAPLSPLRVTLQQNDIS